MAGSQDQQPTKLGTFGGVFTPCTLTILGVIMFLRFGEVVGRSGVFYAIVIVLAAKAITTLTSLSLAAIATNTRVKGGGAYYLISRSLGVEFGGAIGILFFLAQAISVAMYVIGFSEAVVGTFPGFGNFMAIATVTNTVVFVCVYIGAGWTIRVQYFILAALVAALVSFFCGAVPQFDVGNLKENLGTAFGDGESLSSMFALFFPAVTGIMAGANMSGDLANPSRSIPRGTLIAVAVTGVIYLLMAVLLGGVAPREDLIANSFVIRDVSHWPVFITVGVFAATLSSALGSMMGAPRILQAFARDEIFQQTKFFAVGSGKSNEPRRAVVLTYLISEVAIVAGDLNAIAPIITMFFMVTYGLLNVATFYEAVTKNPSYRPTFKYCHWTVSLLGAVGCVAVMFLINWIWAVIAIAVITGLEWFIRTREIESRWGDLQSGVAFERARQALLRLQDEVYHPKNWRPSILALSGTAWTRPHVAQYSHWLTAGHGVLSLAHVVTGDLEEHADRRERYEKTLRGFIAKQQLQAFPAVVVSPTLSDGILALLQCHGLGGLRPNTIMVGWPNESEKSGSFGQTVRLSKRMGRSVIAARFLDYREERLTDSAEATDIASETLPIPSGPIDVWWRGMTNGSLMLLLAHLLHQNPEWRRKSIRVLRVVPNAEAVADVSAHIEELAASSRIHVEPVVVVSDNVAQTIQQTSESAAVVFFGLQHPEEGDEVALFERIESLVGNLPRVFLIDSAGGMALES